MSFTHLNPPLLVHRVAHGGQRAWDQDRDFVRAGHTHGSPPHREVPDVGLFDATASRRAQETMRGHRVYHAVVAVSPFMVNVSLFASESLITHELPSLNFTPCLVENGATHIGRTKIKTLLLHTRTFRERFFRGGRDRGSGRDGGSGGG